MKLLPDWKYIAKHSWAFLIGAIAFVLTGLETYITVFGADWFPEWVSKGARMSIIMCVAGAAPIARLFAQRNMSKESSDAEA